MEISKFVLRHKCRKGYRGLNPVSFGLEGCAKYQALGDFAEALNAVCRQ
jgi:hypothetical protein